MKRPDEAASPDRLAPVIGLAKRLDPDAFEVLVDEYSPRLYEFLSRL